MCLSTRTLYPISWLRWAACKLRIPHVRPLRALEDVLSLELFHELIVQLQVGRRGLLRRNGCRDAPLFGLCFCHGSDAEVSAAKEGLLQGALARRCCGGLGAKEWQRQKLFVSKEAVADNGVLQC